MNNKNVSWRCSWTVLHYFVNLMTWPFFIYWRETVFFVSSLSFRRFCILEKKSWNRSEERRGMKKIKKITEIFQVKTKTKKKKDCIIQEIYSENNIDDLTEVPVFFPLQQQQKTFFLSFLLSFFSPSLSL